MNSSNVNKNLLPDETILFQTKKHIIIFFIPFVLTFFSFYATDYMHADQILTHLQLAPALVTLLLWGYIGLDYMTSQYAVTNKRILMREGFFNRHATEMRLVSISQINVDQNLLGQLLNYGTVTLNAFGANDTFPMIAKPFLFQKFVNEELDKVSR